MMPESVGTNSHLIVVGASAGGVEALRERVRGRPADLAAASRWPPILNKSGRLKAQHAAVVRNVLKRLALPPVPGGAGA